MDALPRLFKPSGNEKNDLLTPIPLIRRAQRISTPSLLNKSKRIPRAHKLSLIHLNIQSLKNRIHLLQLLESAESFATDL
mgnify:FL=1